MQQPSVLSDRGVARQGRSTRSTSSCSRSAAFFAVLIAVLVVVLRGQVPPAARGRGRRRRSTGRSRSSCSGRDPARARAGDVRVGRAGLLRRSAAAQGRDGGLRRRQAVDVEDPAPRRRSGRSTSCTCRSAAREADDDVGGRHPRLLRAGVPREGGRGSRAATRRCGSRRRSRARIISSAREYCGTEHSGMIGTVDRDDAGTTTRRG